MGETTKTPFVFNVRIPCQSAGSDFAAVMPAQLPAKISGIQLSVAAEPEGVPGLRLQPAYCGPLENELTNGSSSFLCVLHYLSIYNQSCKRELVQHFNDRKTRLKMSNNMSSETVAGGMELPSKYLI